jgi:23S rRNA (guanosine2251-2'-O)-methyltransferase
MSPRTGREGRGGNDGGGKQAKPRRRHRGARAKGAGERSPVLVVGGPHAVEAALERRDQVRSVLVEQGATGRAQRLAERARSLGVPLSIVSLGEADRLSGVRAQGVAAEIGFRYRDLADLLDADAGLLVFLDGIEDPHNLGAILRTADAAGALAVVIPGRRSAPVTAAVVRASAGGALRVPVCRVSNLVQAMDAARRTGFWLVGLAADAPELLAVGDAGAKIGLVVGAEASGMRRLVAERCDSLARLPMQAGAESLNASVAAALAIYRLQEPVLYGPAPVDTQRGD